MSPSYKIGFLDTSNKLSCKEKGPVTCWYQTLESKVSKTPKCQTHVCMICMPLFPKISNLKHIHTISYICSRSSPCHPLVIICPPTSATAKPLRHHQLSAGAQKSWQSRCPVCLADPCPTVLPLGQGYHPTAKQWLPRPKANWLAPSLLWHRFGFQKPHAKICQEPLIALEVSDEDQRQSKVTWKKTSDRVLANSRMSVMLIKFTLSQSKWHWKIPHLYPLVICYIAIEHGDL